MLHHDEEFLKPYLPKARLACAINVGAHEGGWVAELQKCFQSVIAVECDPHSVKILEERFPRGQGVEVIDAAGWIVSGQTMDFHVREGAAHMSSALACRDILRDGGVAETIRVATIAIDDIPKQACDLILVDVEGSEVQVLMGATKTIEAWHPDLLVETHEPEHRAWCQEWLLRAGYNVALLHEPHREMSDEWGRHVYVVAQYYRFRGSY